MEILWFAAVGLAASAIAARILRRNDLGLIGDVVFGVVGAVFAGSLFGRLGLSAAGGVMGSLIFAAIGATALLLLLRIVYGSR